MSTSDGNGGGGGGVGNADETAPTRINPESAERIIDGGSGGGGGGGGRIWVRETDGAEAVQVVVIVWKGRNDERFLATT